MKNSCFTVIYTFPLYACLHANSSETCHSQIIPEDTRYHLHWSQMRVTADVRGEIKLVHSPIVRAKFTLLIWHIEHTLIIHMSML